MKKEKGTEQQRLRYIQLIEQNFDENAGKIMRVQMTYFLDNIVGDDNENPGIDGRLAIFCKIVHLDTESWGMQDGVRATQDDLGELLSHLLLDAVIGYPLCNADGNIVSIQ
ncbi:hypothetical protein FWH09_00700 [Candidatus Saccharibacteria bacterium]|nr:hypothetical protein [Candidatus Saccharibacteria bacterium]